MALFRRWIEPLYLGTMHGTWWNTLPLPWNTEQVGARWFLKRHCCFLIRGKFKSLSPLSLFLLYAKESVTHASLHRLGFHFTLMRVLMPCFPKDDWFFPLLWRLFQFYLKGCLTAPRIKSPVINRKATESPFFRRNLIRCKGDFSIAIMISNQEDMPNPLLTIFCSTHLAILYFRESVFRSLPSFSLPLCCHSQLICIGATQSCYPSYERREHRVEE